MKFNEEFIKNNILMPFLNDIGFSEYELEFENTFNIQLGRGVYNVKNDQVNEAGGRLDILCKIDGKNLFVIEMKAEEVEISDKDRRQALSYARLVEPMAAYSIVSNGKRTILYDTITGKEVEQINNNVFSGDFVLELDEELSKLRFEALKSFIGYSYSNLLAFCKLNNGMNLSKFCAKDSDEFSKKIEFKYIPELYVKREVIEDKFVEFIKQRNKKVFAVIGESGVGKTNILCYLSQKYIDNPFLFFSGSIMGKVLLDEILNDFNTVFSSEESKISLLRKLSTIANIHDKEIIFIIDAIDEWEAEDKVLQLNQLVKYINNLNIKICISCKTLMWKEFKIKNGINTHVQDNIFFETPILGGFLEKEFDEAIDKYCSFFQTSFTDKASLNNVQNPFSLRIACEVANIDKQQLDNCIDSIETMKKYISCKLDKINNKKLAKRYLRGISEYMLNNDKILVLEESIRNYLKLGISEEIPEELFAFNFLYKFVDESSNLNIGFYFSGVRDYIIAMEILKLNTLNGEEVQKRIFSILSNYIGENSLVYYFKTGNTKNKEDCLKALIEYDKIHDTNMIIKILSLKEILLYENISEILHRDIINNLKNRFLKLRDNGTIAIDIISIMGKFHDIENELIDMFSILLKYPEDDFKIVSCKIAKLLSRYDSNNGSLRLVRMVLNQNNDGYIRRYIADSLANRNIENKEEIFLKLITDNDPNVRDWIKKWYYELEDEKLRDMLLSRIDNNVSFRVKQDIFDILGKSKINNTAENIYSKILNRWNDEVSIVLACESLAELQFEKAIPILMNILESNPNSDWKGRIAMALMKLNAKESVKLLLDIIKRNINKKEAVVDYQINLAFARLASVGDIQSLIDYAKSNNNKNMCIRVGNILAQCVNRDYSELIFEIINDTDFNIIERSNILSYYADNIIRNKVKYFNRKNVLENLYSLFEKDNKVSVVALGFLLTIETDLERLSSTFKKVIPKLSYLIYFNMIYSKPENICLFVQRIIEWVNNELIKIKGGNDVYTKNLLILCSLGEQKSSIEAIHSNMENLIKITGKEFIEHIVHCITNGKRY